MHVLNITQSGTLLDGKPNLSHPNYALDLAGSNSGIDPYYNFEEEIEELNAELFERW